MTDTSTMSAVMEAAEEPVVEQHKMDPTLQNYLIELEKRAFVHDFRIDTHNPIAPQIAAHWPHLQGWEKEEEELLGRMVGVIGKIPSVKDRKMPLIFMRVIAGAEKHAPITIFEPRETQALGSWDSTDGIGRSCVVLPAETLPALDHMAVASGLIMASQTETGFYDETRDMRINGYGGGPGIYDTERNHDQMQKPNQLGDGPYIDNPISPAQHAMNPSGLPQAPHATPQEESGPANAELLAKEGEVAAIEAGIIAAEEAHRLEERYREENHRQEKARETENKRVETLRHENLSHEAIQRDEETARHRANIAHAPDAAHASPMPLPRAQNEERRQGLVGGGESRSYQTIQNQQQGAQPHSTQAASGAHEITRAEEISMLAGAVAIAEQEVTSAPNREQMLDSTQFEPKRPETRADENLVASEEAQEGTITELLHAQGAVAVEPTIGGESVVGIETANGEVTPGGIKIIDDFNNENNEVIGAEPDQTSETSAEQVAEIEPNGSEPEQSEIGQAEAEQLEPQQAEINQAELNGSEGSEVSAQRESPEASQTEGGQDQSLSQQESEPSLERETQPEEFPEQEQQAGETSGQEESQEALSEEAPEESSQQEPQSAEEDRGVENNETSENAETRDVDQGEGNQDTHAEESEDARPEEDRGAERDDAAADSEENAGAEREGVEGERAARAENADYVVGAEAETLDNNANGDNRQQDNQMPLMSDEVLRHGLHEATLHHMIETSLGHNVAAAAHGAAGAGGAATIVHHVPSSPPPAPNMSGLNARPATRHLAMTGVSAAAIAGAHTGKSARQPISDAPVAAPRKKRVAQALAIKQPVLRAKTPRTAKSLLKKKLSTAKKKVHAAQQDQASSATPVAPATPAPTLDI